MFVPLIEFKGYQKDLGFRMIDGIKFYDEQKYLSVSNRRKGKFQILTSELNMTTDYVVFCNYSDSNTKEWYFKTVIKGKIDSSYYSTDVLSIPHLIYSN